MKLNWKQTSPTQIDIHANPRGVLIAVGIPFLAIGFYLLSQVFGALWDVLFRKVPFMDDILAFTLLPVFAGLFLWPGLLLVFARKRFTINAATGEVAETTSLRFYEWHRKHAFSGFKTVRAYQGKADTRTMEDLDEEDNYPAPQPYCVDLVPSEAKGTSPTIGATSKPGEATELGRAVAALMKISFVDETGRGGFRDARSITSSL